MASVSIINALTKEVYDTTCGSLKERDFFRVIDIDGVKQYFENESEYHLWCANRRSEQQKAERKIARSKVNVLDQVGKESNHRN